MLYQISIDKQIYFEGEQIFCKIVLIFKFGTIIR